HRQTGSAKGLAEPPFWRGVGGTGDTVAPSTKPCRRLTKNSLRGGVWGCGNATNFRLMGVWGRGDMIRIFFHHSFISLRTVRSAKTASKNPPHEDGQNAPSGSDPISPSASRTDMLSLALTASCARALLRRRAPHLGTTMAAKWTTEDLKVGLEMEATFWPNPVAGSKFRFRATHLDGLRAPKVVLCDDPRIQPGVPCSIKIVNIRKRKRQDRGAIEVEFLKQKEFQFEGVYLDPLIAKQLQVLLESGLNILLDGPQGCGKTVLARSIAKTLGMEFIFFNCGAVIEASDFLATIQVRASATGQPVTDFLKTEVLVALEEAGEHPERRYLVFLDELNRCPENARNALMPALDSTRRIFHPIENRFLAIPA